MFDLPPFCTRMPPADSTRFGQPRSSIQRTMSSMWMHISPMMPLPYSMNARHQRRCGSGSFQAFGFGGGSYGRRGAGPGPRSLSKGSRGFFDGGGLFGPHVGE